MRQDYENGKYTVIFDREEGGLRALRYGEPWQDLCGNHLVYFMLVEHKHALEQRAELLEALKDMVGCMEQENPLSYAENIRNAKEAITRAEAAE